MNFIQNRNRLISTLVWIKLLKILHMLNIMLMEVYQNLQQVQLASSQLYSQILSLSQFGKLLAVQKGKGLNFQNFNSSF